MGLPRQTKTPDSPFGNFHYLHRLYECLYIKVMTYRHPFDQARVQQSPKPEYPVKGLEHLQPDKQRWLPSKQLTKPRQR